MKTNALNDPKNDAFLLERWHLAENQIAQR